MIIFLCVIYTTDFQPSVIRITGCSGPSLSHLYRITEGLLYLSFLSCSQPDDNHVWSKHVADLWTEYIFVFWLDLRCIFDHLIIQRGWIVHKLFKNVNPVTNQIYPQWRLYRGDRSWMAGCSLAWYCTYFMSEMKDSLPLTRFTHASSIKSTDCLRFPLGYPVIVRIAKGVRGGGFG